MIEQLKISHDYFVKLRRDLHQHPELQFQEIRTAGIVARELASYGYRIETGVAATGVIGTLTKGTSRRSYALRADMDALPMQEETNLAYASIVPGRMHACGHDGHTTTLLAAAKNLAENGRFDGTIHVIFQPAEEDISGAKRMIEDGVFDRMKVDGIFAFHNIPGLDVGQVVVKSGAITARADIVDIVVRGVGGHGALPHQAKDPIVAAASIVMALQTLVSRNLDPTDVAVVTTGAIHGGSLATIIPSAVNLKIGVRTVTKKAAEMMRQRLPELVKSQARSFGCESDVLYGEGISYPAGMNNTKLAVAVKATAIALGQDPEIVEMSAPFMFSEDFAFIQECVPGCYFGLGNGASRSLHDAGYDFNDELISHGAKFWVNLIERVLK